VPSPAGKRQTKGLRTKPLHRVKLSRACFKKMRVGGGEGPDHITCDLADSSKMAGKEYGHDHGKKGENGVISSMHCHSLHWSSAGKGKSKKRRGAMQLRGWGNKTGKHQRRRN